MGKFTFRYLSHGEAHAMFPRMFDILYTNMMAIAPSDAGYQEDLQLWMSYIAPAMEQGNTEVVLMIAGEELAGYVQYSFREDTVLVEEVEIQPAYQRTMLFYRCVQFLLGEMPEKIRYLESYVDKDNCNSLSIHRKQGMEIIGENRSGRGWHMRGNVETVSRRFIR